MIFPIGIKLLNETGSKTINRLNAIMSVEDKRMARRLDDVENWDEL